MALQRTKQRFADARCVTNPQTNIAQVNSEDDGDENTRDESEDEEIFVTRKEEQIDPEEAADFDRAFQSMMAESMDSRKFERRTMFDVPLPMRPVQRQPINDDEEEREIQPEGPQTTMAFSLMTKKGNRQQVRTFCGTVEKLVLTALVRRGQLPCLPILPLLLQLETSKKLNAKSSNELRISFSIMIFETRTIKTVISTFLFLFRPSILSRPFDRIRILKLPVPQTSRGM